jgi:nicotinamidase-related amidase
MNDHAELLSRGDCTLLLVDIQETLLAPCISAGPLKDNVAILIEIALLLDIPIIFTAHNAEKLGGPLAQLEGMVTEPKVYNKLEFSCFENDSINRALLATGRRTLLMAGIESHVCVFHTGASALKLGYRVHVAADAVTSRSALNRDTGLRRLEKAGAVISSTEMIIYELLNRAGTPEFRAALPILKRASGVHQL